MDRITTAMCEKSYGRASFARVLVEVNSVKGLVDEVEVWYRSLNRGGYSRGGFNNSGRGSFGGGRGGYMNNGGRDNGVNKQYVPVRGNVKNVSNKKEGIKEDKKDLDKRGNNFVNEVDFVNENGSVHGSNSKKNNADNGLSSKNRFSMLNDDEGSEELIKWREFCARIDVACEIGITINEAEKLTWSEKMMDYFLAKLKNNIDKVLTPEEVLKNMMNSLQK
ncbi:hypothetical protein Tco_0035648 [Tanacetum coccineum]